MLMLLHIDQGHIGNNYLLLIHYLDLKFLGIHFDIQAIQMSQKDNRTVQDISDKHWCSLDNNKLLGK
jgi:hypothetical protein